MRVFQNCENEICSESESLDAFTVWIVAIRNTVTRSTDSLDIASSNAIPDFQERAESRRKTKEGKEFFPGSLERR